MEDEDDEEDEEVEEIEDGVDVTISVANLEKACVKFEGGRPLYSSHCVWLVHISFKR